MQWFILTLLWFGIITTGLMAGVYLTLTVLVTSLSQRSEPRSGLEAMTIIVRISQRRIFMSLFVSSISACLILSVIALARLDLPASPPMLAGGGLHIVGTYTISALVSVRLINAMMGTNPENEADKAVWEELLPRWLLWNNIRVAACILSMIALILAVRLS